MFCHSSVLFLLCVAVVACAYFLSGTLLSLISLWTFTCSYAPLDVVAGEPIVQSCRLLVCAIAHSYLSRAHSLLHHIRNTDTRHTVPGKPQLTP